MREREKERKKNWLFVISPDLRVGIPNLLGATHAPPEQVRDSVVLARRDPKEPKNFKEQSGPNP